MTPVSGHYLVKTNNPNIDAVGDYYMLRSGFWVQLLAGGLWAGPYKTADSVTFTLVA